jgi:hypothetical protein
LLVEIPDEEVAEMTADLLTCCVETFAAVVPGVEAHATTKSFWPSNLGGNTV